MERMVYAAVILGTILAGCSTEKWADVPDPVKPATLSETKKTDEAYNVYSAILRSLGPRLIVIRPTTRTGILSWPVPLDGSPELTDEIIASYELDNQSPVVLENRFSGEGEYILSEAADDYRVLIEKADRTGKRLLGTLTFSRVGFNQDMTRALVYAGYNCGALCGSGDFYYLVKSEKGWDIAWERNMFKS